jgi:hypothetical protein
METGSSGENLFGDGYSIFLTVDDQLAAELTQCRFAKFYIALSDVLALGLHGSAVIG